MRGQRSVAHLRVAGDVPNLEKGLGLSLGFGVKVIGLGFEIYSLGFAGLGVCQLRVYCFTTLDVLVLIRLKIRTKSSRKLVQ